MGSVGIRRFPTGLHGANLELGLKQCSFHHTMQVLRTYDCLRLFFVFRFSAMLWSLLPFGSGQAADLSDILQILSRFVGDTV